MPEALDRRRHALRDDLADSSLEGRVDLAGLTPKFVSSTPAWVSAFTAPMHRAPRPGAPLDNELVFGETVMLFERKDGWAWVQSTLDGYVGYVPATTLTEGTCPPPSHIVGKPTTLLFDRPDIKAPNPNLISGGSRLSVLGAEARFLKVVGINGRQGYVTRSHLVPIAELGRKATANHEPGTMTFDDPVEIALQYLNVPYLWGGRSGVGLDCSGLIQLAMQGCGIDAPRDTDMQEAELGAPLPFDGNTDSLEQGDLIFWRGHVGFFVTGDQILHANATDMCVALTPFYETIQRIEAGGDGPVTSVRRVVPNTQQAAP